MIRYYGKTSRQFSLMGQMAAPDEETLLQVNYAIIKLIIRAYSAKEITPSLTLCAPSLTRCFHLISITSPAMT